MKSNNFSTTIVVDKTTAEVFEAVNNVSGWWTENLTGNSQHLNDEFEVRFGDVHYSKQKLVEVIPDKRVVWLVTDSRLNFIEDKDEWTNTRIVFDITSKDNKTVLRFTQEGLVPEIECYDACSNAWGGYVTESLRRLIEEGQGLAEPKE